MYYVLFQVVLDTIHVTVRTIIFVVIIIYEPQQAIYAFSLAQIVSQIVYLLGYIIFFGWYIKNLNRIRKNGHTDVDNPIFKDMKDFQFESLYDFLPGCMKNHVSNSYYN